MPEYNPRIYVACLAAYNSGTLHGKWIDADQDADDIVEEVREMLAASPQPNAEEHAIHDYEGFGPIKLSESERFETIAQLAAALSEHGEAFALFYASGLTSTNDVESAISDFEERFRGEYDSVADYVEEFWEEIGELPKPDQWWHPHNYTDWERMAKDLELSGDITAERNSDGNFFIYDNH